MALTRRGGRPKRHERALSDGQLVLAWQSASLLLGYPVVAVTDAAALLTVAGVA